MLWGQACPTTGSDRDSLRDHVLTLFTGTSKLVKRWYLYFFLDKRYSCFGMNGRCDKTRNRLHIYRRPCCTTEGADPDTNRSVGLHWFLWSLPIGCHKKLVEFSRRRSELFFASSDSRLARNQTTISINNFPHQPMPAQWPWPPTSPPTWRPRSAACAHTCRRAW